MRKEKEGCCQAIDQQEAKIPIYGALMEACFREAITITNLYYEHTEAGARYAAMTQIALAIYDRSTDKCSA